MVADRADGLDQALLDTAHAAADAAAGPCLAHFRAEGLSTRDKGGEAGYDPVTVADRQAEAAVRAVLADRRPQDAVLGEEAGRSSGTSGLTWVVDPIDGTRSFVIGAPVWGVLIALNDGTRPRLGLVDQPYVGDRFWGDGERAWHRLRDGPARPIRTRAGVKLAEARLCSTFPEIGTPEEAAAFARVRDAVQLTRYGLDCTAYALLAAGCVDLVVEAGLYAYDVQALIPLVEGAGGRMTTWEGGDAQHGGRILAAASEELHREAMALLAG